MSGTIPLNPRVVPFPRRQESFRQPDCVQAAPAGSRRPWATAARLRQNLGIARCVASSDHRPQPRLRYVGAWEPIRAVRRTVAPPDCACVSFMVAHTGWATLVRRRIRRWALCVAIVGRCSPSSVIGVDPSEGFLVTAKENLAGRAAFRQGTATASLSVTRPSMSWSRDGMRILFRIHAPRSSRWRG
jgi:hypothetical protein